VMCVCLRYGRVGLDGAAGTRDRRRDVTGAAAAAGRGYGGSSWARRRIAAAAVAAWLAVGCTLPARAARAGQPNSAVSLQTFTFARLSLDRAIALALARSPGVAQAVAERDRAQALLVAAQGAYGPSATLGYAAAPQAGAVSGTVEQHLITAGIQTTLGDVFARQPAVAQAQAQLQAAQSSLVAAQAAERQTVIGLYFDALRARALADAAASGLELAQAEREAAGVRYGAGDAPRLDVVRADVAVAQARAQEATARAAERNARQALALETGVDPASLVELEPVASPSSPSFGVGAPGHTAEMAAQAVGGQTQTDEQQQESDVAAAIQRALARRPEIAAANADVAAAQAAYRVSRQAILPAVTLSAGVTRGVDTGVPVSGPSASVSVSVPFGPAARGRADADRLLVNEAQDRLEAVRRSIEVEVGAAVRSYLAQVSAAESAARAAREAQAELTALQIGYRHGASSSLEVETARQTYEQALLAAIAAAYDRDRAAAVLALLEGG
jgi:outer membrane protein TolC